MRHVLPILALFLANVRAATPSTCCYNQILDFEALEQVAPVADALIPRNLETKGIRFKSFGFGYKQPGLNVAPDPRGAYYAYYGTTTTTTGTGFPGLTLNYQGADLKYFTITKLVGACSFIVPISVAQLRCDITLKAYKDGTTALGNETYTFYTSLGAQQALYDQKVDLTEFTAKDWTTANFETAYSVKLAGTDNFISIDQATSKLGINLKPMTFLDNIEMTVSPKACSNCLA